MASTSLRQRIRDVTLYLVYLIFVTTLGPLQFGFHLVRETPLLLGLNSILTHVVRTECASRYHYV
jgi:hypothetical protein